MPRGPAGGLLVFLRRLPPAPDSDADLLARFARERDGGAFAALVARHGPMVFAACRRALGEGADAEDAFQAVFVALAQRAERVGAVPGWLHRVAVRTARKLAARRRATVAVPADVAEAPAPDLAERELLAALDAEVEALPERLRTAVTLCGLEGRTNTEAAALLGCPVGTVDSRLHAAKQKLRDRLARRGFTVPAIGSAFVAISLETARAAEPAARLAPAVLETLSGGPPSPAVSAILKEMTTVNNRFQLLVATGLALVLTVVLTGVALVLRAADDPPVPPVPPPPPGVTTRIAPPDAPNLADAKPDKEKAYQNALVAAMQHLADSYGEAEHLAALLERHPKLVNEIVTYKQPRKPSTTDGFTALHFAARRGNSRAVEVLIQYKADVNLDAGGGWTALHLAAQSGDLESVKLLVKAGAKTDAKTRPVEGGVAPGSPPGGPDPDTKPVVLPAIPAMTPLDVAKNGKRNAIVEYLSGLK